MEKDSEARPKKQRDETKPGTIVAGPDAHARERKGQDPSHKTQQSESSISRSSPPTGGKQSS